MAAGALVARFLASPGVSPCPAAGREPEWRKEVPVQPVLHDGRELALVKAARLVVGPEAVGSVYAQSEPQLDQVGLEKVPP